MWGGMDLKGTVMKSWCCLELAKVITTSVVCPPGFEKEVDLV